MFFFLFFCFVFLTLKKIDLVNITIKFDTSESLEFCIILRNIILKNRLRLVSTTSLGRKKNAFRLSVMSKKEIR